MNREALKDLLNELSEGKINVEEAIDKLKYFPYSDLGFARIDHHREIRTGYPEIVFCEGKTTAQVRDIFRHISETGQNAIGTRANKEKYEVVSSIAPEAIWYEEARIISIIKNKNKEAATPVAVITAGTSDIPVAEEAAVTCELLGNRVNRIYDAGVAGIHRLFDKLSDIKKCRVVIVIAGMEGALASVVGGLIDKPVIAVPTSVGYGANFNGISALLAMLTSCASGVSVVNIDNGFGAGFNASMINQLK
ncbi:MAG TPA: nickel pincer cofactor biosynthesis protein LarB [Bacteroidales bacterium]|nr:nickel pincer cofactor biosynthesis protein LarB [Bacteroidales bacterium]